MVFSKGKPSWCEGRVERCVFSCGELWEDAPAGEQQSRLDVSPLEWPPRGFPRQKPQQLLHAQQSGSRERMSRE